VERLTWRGPKRLWSKDAAECILQTTEARSPGVYFWAVEIDGEYWVNYVGMTRYDIAARQVEHLEGFLSGHYLTYDPKALRGGHKDLLHDPGGASRIERFLTGYQNIAGQLLDLFEMLSVFYMPLDRPTEDLKQVESALIQLVRTLGGKEAGFLDNDRLSVRIPPERALEFEFPCVVRGLGRQCTFLASALADEGARQDQDLR